MRTLPLLLAAAVSLLLSPTALAGERTPKSESACREPGIDLDYDLRRFTVSASLPVSGCRSRENSEFILSTSISRLDNDRGRDLIDRSAVCGPFRPAEAPEGRDRTCSLAVSLGHPDVEHAQYDVEVSYPGPSGRRTAKVFTFCTADGTDASCQG